MPFAVYILASRMHGTLYIGMTRDLARRMHEHRTGATPGFASQYAVHRLVWYETHDRAVDAIQREKTLKKYRRDWKLRMIESANPDWSDLYPTLGPWPAG